MGAVAIQLFTSHQLQPTISGSTANGANGTSYISFSDATLMKFSIEIPHR